ncbi:calcium-binding protein CML [Trypanosoma rangeli]|uniref:Calcium-binding protein CML n=1 Tax=Trypanosoma rangeli TaxID=5698 RepID=A0A422NIP8_TRYRA|nr:calcium-binding protein CML [Trypanosoma rangeli]RNF05336.1 calcium-binding protein CML [Trypanosoma rangeli]|eukprot:RNF05336.1 calcium-binding protein CML [Trypanosoma rangeli]
MGYSFSRAQMEDYKELVKDRFSEEAIEFLYAKFHKAAPEGAMTPVEFKRYIDSTDVYKNYRQTHLTAPLLGGIKSASGIGGGNAAVKKTSRNVVDREMYLHLFRAYDRDCDGVISFREFLLYHLAVMYSTEELFVVVFNAYDDDQDGYLSLADIISTITAATRYVGDCDVEDQEVQRVIEEEAQRLMFFLDVRKDGRIRRDDMRLITQKHPEVLEKMKNLM